jgi:hypothetical protein
LVVGCSACEPMYFIGRQCEPMSTKNTRTAVATAHSDSSKSSKRRRKHRPLTKVDRQGQSAGIGYGAGDE